MEHNEGYKNSSDEAIICCARKGETEAIDYLLVKYKSLVKQKAGSLFIIGGDKDDLIQEGMIGLYKAIRDFKSDKNTSFYQFAELCISRQIYNAIKASNRKKNLPLNTYISLYSPISGGGRNDSEMDNLVDTIDHKKDLDPEKLFIDKESTNMIEYELEKRLSQLEKDVVLLFIEGMSYLEIAEVLEREPKSIDNALQRIKTKLNQVLRIHR